MSLVLACTSRVTCQPVPTDYQHAVDLSQGFLGVGPGGPGGPGGSEGVDICSPPSSLPACLNINIIWGLFGSRGNYQALTVSVLCLMLVLSSLYPGPIAWPAFPSKTSPAISRVAEWQPLLMPPQGLSAFTTWRGSGC